jgi:hypothetical protein
VSVVVRVICAADGLTQTPHDGRWIVEWNPHVPFGTLAVTSTADRAKAKRFPSGIDAMRQWQTVSRAQAYRPDGEPNRPLAALTVEIDPA